LAFIGTSDHDLRGRERYLLRTLAPARHTVSATHAYFRAAAVPPGRNPTLDAWEIDFEIIINIEA
jgi:hypothetical protein